MILTHIAWQGGLKTLTKGCRVSLTRCRKAKTTQVIQCMMMMYPIVTQYRGPSLQSSLITPPSSWYYVRMMLGYGSGENKRFWCNSPK
jgi:hypothetical protein